MNDKENYKAAVHAAIEKEIIRHERLAEMLSLITRVYKKDGGDFVSLEKNFACLDPSLTIFFFKKLPRRIQG